MENIAVLTESQRQIAMERFRLLEPFLQGEVPLPRVAQSAGIPLRTAQRWVALYRQHGLAGLIRRRRQDHGEHRLADPLQEFVEGLALRRPPPTVAAIHRQVSLIAQERGEPAPGYWQVWSVVHNLPPALTTLAHEGSKAYSEQFDLIYRREAEAPNVIWQADHTPLDILLLRDGQEPARPWLTTVIDDYSRAIAGYLLYFEAPSALHTSLALRQAIWRKGDPRWHVCGIPSTFYTDNGSDFTSRHLEQVSADLKIELSFSTPGVPRGRGKIERFFETVNMMLLASLPGYTPARGTPQGEPKLTLPEFELLFVEFLLGVYHQRAHGETGVPPQERWEAGGFLPHMPESLEQLDLLLVNVAKARKVHPDGIHFGGLRYMDTTLAAYVGEWVTLRYDPRDMAEIRVFYEDRFLCRAVCQELAGETVSLREIIRARNRRRRELRQVLTERAQVVDTLLSVHQDPSPVAGEPAATSQSTPPAKKLRRYLND